MPEAFLHHAWQSRAPHAACGAAECTPSPRSQPQPQVHSRVNCQAISGSRNRGAPSADGWCSGQAARLLLLWDYPSPLAARSLGASAALRCELSPSQGLAGSLVYPALAHGPSFGLLPVIIRVAACLACAEGGP